MSFLAACILSKGVNSTLQKMYSNRHKRLRNEEEPENLVKKDYSKRKRKLYMILEKQIRMPYKKFIVYGNSVQSLNYAIVIKLSLKCVVF